MREFFYKDDRMYCEQVEVQHLAQEFGTPLYIYSKSSIVDHCKHLEQAFDALDHLSCYAVKANSNPTILSLITQQGLGADVGSEGELYLARKAGFPSEKITFSGVGKSPREISYALQENILAFNVESESELLAISEIATRQKQQARILFRVNFDLEAKTHPYITTGRKQNKFGIAVDEVKHIIQRAQSLPSIEVLGVHVHLGSQITSVEVFVNAAQRVCNYIEELRVEGIPIHHLNFGGGFGVQYLDFITHPSLPKEESADESHISIGKFIEAVVPILKTSGCKVLIQPGRSVIAHAGILVTKVLYIKRQESKAFVIVDAGMNDFMRPMLYQSYHQIVPLMVKDSAHHRVDVVGPLCESGDYFALDRLIPEVNEGEYLSLMCVGAYGYVLASNYNGRLRPAEVLVDGSNVSIIRKREKIESL
jgi:diaminopimelate decarboxylase